MQLLQKHIAGAPAAAQQRRGRVQSTTRTTFRVQAATATEVKLNTKMSDEVSAAVRATAAASGEGRCVERAARHLQRTGSLPIAKDHHQAS